MDVALAKDDLLAAYQGVGVGVGEVVDWPSTELMVRLVQVAGLFGCDW